MKIEASTTSPLRRIGFRLKGRFGRYNTGTIQVIIIVIGLSQGIRLYGLRGLEYREPAGLKPKFKAWIVTQTAPLGSLKAPYVAVAPRAAAGHYRTLAGQVPK